MRVKHSMRAVLVLTTLGVASPTLAAAGSQELQVVGAVRQGDTRALRALLVKRADVNAPEPDGTTALHWAAHQGDLDSVKLLIQAGANAKATNRFGVTPLWLAGVDGKATVVDALLRAGADPNTTRADSGETVLMIAAKSGSPEVVKLLLARGASVNTVEPLRGQTALMWAAAEHHPDVVKVLVEAGANTKTLSKTKMSALMFAIRAGDIESTTVLLDAGIDVNEPASDGTPMLILAIVNARFDLAAFLLERGADANVEDKLHGTPLQVLAFLRRADNRSLSIVIPRQLPNVGLDTFGMASALLKHGANVNARYGNKAGGTGLTAIAVPKHMALSSYRTSFAGATPFYIAAITSDVPFMRFLAANGADPNIRTNAGMTPLLAAAGIGFWEGEQPGTQEEAFEAVKLAAELGNDPTAAVDLGETGDPTWNKATAMHGAANRGADEMVKWLVEKGVPIDAKSVRGLSAYHIAAGLDGGLFHAWPKTAELILQLAKQRGVSVDTTEPPPAQRSRRGAERPAATGTPPPAATPAATAPQP